MRKFFYKVFDFFSSIKLAVILILSLAVILATGTFYEAAHGTENAQRVIYHSWYVTTEMFLLIVNLACAAIDRIPWKKYHIGFVVTHAGIIILLLGSFVTQKQGIDGNLALSVNEASDSFIVNEKELHVYQALDGKPFFLLYQKPIDFDRHPPEKENFLLKLVDDDQLHILKYYQHAVRQLDVVDSGDKTKNMAIQFRLHNQRVDVSEWIGLDRAIPSFYDLGPASVILIAGPLPTPPQPRNQIVVYQPDPKSPKLKYAIFSVRQKEPTHQGDVVVGQENDTGWMGLKFCVEKFAMHGNPSLSYTEADPEGKDTGELPAAIEMEIVPTGGHGRSQAGSEIKWAELENPVEIKGDKTSYFVRLARKQYPLGFQIALKKFKMGIYGGSSLPMSYESTVLVNNQKEQVISMNEPLKFKNFTLYQASYETNDRGEPIATVLSVNFDPGRSMKYFGAILICSGIAIMFYLKPRWTRKKRTA